MKMHLREHLTAATAGVATYLQLLASSAYAPGRLQGVGNGIVMHETKLAEDIHPVHDLSRRTALAGIF